jgi:osmotically-inducible protein OsmY
MLSTIAERLPGRKSKSVASEVPKRAAQAIGAGAGVVTIIVLSGRRRRKATVGRVVGLVRRRNSNDLNDPTLAHKVESEIFRGDDVPKGSINVNAENGVIYLRGEVSDPEQVERLGKAARSVSGVREVKNLLHAHQG